jgi:hypothetical protein
VFNQEERKAILYEDDLREDDDSGVGGEERVYEQGNKGGV